MRTIDLGTTSDRDTTGRFAAVYTLAYEIVLDGGEWVRITRTTGARSVELLGRKLAMLPEEVVVNIAVTNRAGTDVTFDFDCFRGEEPVVSEPLRRLAYGLMSFVPPAAA